MRAYIKKLQSKSESTRKQIFAGALIVSMSLVAFVWVSSLGYKFSNNNQEKVADDIKPFSMFGKTIADTVSNVSASVGNIKLPQKKTQEEINSKNQIDLIPVEY